MTLHFAPYRGTDSLHAFYRKLADLPHVNPLSKSGAQMLELLPLVADACADADLWGVTSHERLCLREANEYESRCLVIIEPIPGDGFDVRFRLPDNEAPWPGAMVWGHAHTKEDAGAMVRVGVIRSRPRNSLNSSKDEAAQQ